MIRRPPRSTRTDTLFPYTTLFRAVKIDYKGGSGKAQALVEGTSGVPFRIAANADLTPELWRASVRGRATGINFRTTTPARIIPGADRSEEHTSELQSLMRISYAVFCLKKKKLNYNQHTYALI